MPDDVADRVTAIGGDAAAKLLLAVAYSDDALRFSVPSNVIEASRDDGVFLADAFDVVGLPDTEDAAGVTARNLEAIGGKASDGRGGVMGSVLFALGGVIDGANKDGLAGLDKDARSAMICPE